MALTRWCVHTLPPLHPPLCGLACVHIHIESPITTLVGQEVSRSFSETISGSMSGDLDEDDLTTDDEVKCEIDSTLSPSNSRSLENECIEVSADDIMAADMDSDRHHQHKEDITNSLRSIQNFGSGLDGNREGYNMSTLRQQYAADPKRWCEIVNFVVQLHYDMGTPSLKPNIISLTCEYLAIVANRGFLGFPEGAGGPREFDVRRSMDVRMALFEAVKFDQGFQMSISKLFNMVHYDKPMVFSNDKRLYDKLVVNRENIPFPLHDDQKTGQQLVDWLRGKEMEFCCKIDWKFAISTRYQTLMVYLKRLGFDTDGPISMQYKNVKMEYSKLRGHHNGGAGNSSSNSGSGSGRRTAPTFSDEIKFGFLCRYLLEMTYYRPDFYAVTKRDLIVGVIYSAYVVAQRWGDKFRFDAVLSAVNGSRQNLVELMDGKHPVDDPVIHGVIKDIIRIARAPHSCFLCMSSGVVLSQHTH